MDIRKLKEKDAVFMLEWMQDQSIVQNLFTDFSKKREEDCLSFIAKSAMDKENVHLAIIDEKDTYMGTVSLKHINKKRKDAEFAITVRKAAMGKGYSIFGMKKILDLAKRELGLNKVYWCVSKKNIRAVRFYNKHKFKRCFDIPIDYIQFYQQKGCEDLIWYMVQLDENKIKK